MDNRMSYRSYNDYRSFCEDMPTYKTLGDIEKAINKLDNIVKSKGVATLADFYKITDGAIVEGDELYGWRDLNDLNIRRTRYGYMLILPRARKIHFDPNEKIKIAIDILDNAGDDLEEATNEVRELLCEMI